MIKSIEGNEVHNRRLVNSEVMNYETGKALASLYAQLGPYANEEKGLGKSLLDYAMNMGLDGNKSPEVMKARALLNKSVITPMNQRAARVRDIKRSYEDANWLTDPVLEKAIAKSTLDIGSFTNFANITGGQALGYVSLDTRMARGTVRPSSFTLYQALDKSLAWQIVDFWALAKATGGAPPGSAFAGGFAGASASAFPSVASGSLATSAGNYDLLSIVLKLALDGRAITMALAVQNSYVNVSEQETTNAALVVLSTLNWAAYYGDSAIFTNQFDGIQKQVIAGASQSRNFFDYYQFFNNFASTNSWTPEITLYNLIYEAAAQITTYANFGHITHAFMSPTAMGSFASLTVTQLNQILSQLTEMQGATPIHINGNLIGMQTRYGHIQFPMDLFIEARDIPVEAIVVDSTTQVITSINKPTSVALTLVDGTSSTGSNFNGDYTPSNNGKYMYAVASCDASMNETTCTFSTLISGVGTGDGVQVAITPNGATAAAFRIFRSGLGGCTNNSAPAAGEFRYVGNIAANGSSVVTWTDLNGGWDSSLTINSGHFTKIPGSSDIFLLDMDPMDLAIDYRLLLPLVKIDLFASNLFMPWAVASLGSLRLRVPKFHGVIRNYVPTNPTWNPLAIN